jgi:hypothetical protein
MPYSLVDDGFLRSYGFFNLYDTYKVRLLKIAKHTHDTFKTITTLPPNSAEIEILLEFVLTGSSVFAEIVVDLCTNIHLANPQDPYWPEFFAGSVARYVTDREWSDIVI